MKKIIYKNLILTFIFMFNCLVSNAQEKLDIVFMTNGEKKEGKVTLVKSDGITFIYKGENLAYEFKKSEINKIQFASGRTEMFTNASNTLPTTSAVERKGKIAVLPFEFISNDTSLNGEEMSQQLQNDCYNSLKENTVKLQIQDPITTNSTLIKIGINHSNIKAKTPQEMAEILGVEYVIYGNANVTNKGATTYGSGSSTYGGKETQKNGKTKSSGTVYSSNTGTTVTDYGTKIDLNFYNDQGASVYSESRTSFGSGLDAYHATLNYLIKRTPFGTKAKR